MYEYKTPWTMKVWEASSDNSFGEAVKVLDANSATVMLDLREDSDTDLDWQARTNMLNRIVACVNFCVNMKTEDMIGRVVAAVPNCDEAVILTLS